MKTEVLLCNEKAVSGIRVNVTAEIIDGKLRISGQDLGVSNVESFGGASEYEYWYDFDEENTIILRESLLENKDSNTFLQVFKKHFSGINGCAKMRKYCDKRNIKYGFFSHVSD